MNKEINKWQTKGSKVMVNKFLDTLGTLQKELQKNIDRTTTGSCKTIIQNTVFKIKDMTTNTDNLQLVAKI